MLLAAQPQMQFEVVVCMLDEYKAVGAWSVVDSVRYENQMLQSPLYNAYTHQPEDTLVATLSFYDPILVCLENQLTANGIV
jgi:hypothetical protein